MAISTIYGKIFLSLGSNMGDRQHNIHEAVEQLRTAGAATLVAKSSVYETEPWGPVAQDWFFNSAVEIDTEDAPLELLRKSQTIEDHINGGRKQHNMPRKIDIVILL